MKFILLGDVRCGTNLFKDLLNQQKSIYCYNEIFKLPLESNWSKNDFKPKNIIEHLNNKKPFVGFKITLRQADILSKKYNFLIEEYIKDKNIKVIFIERKNQFLKSVSLQKARITNCFQIKKINNQLINNTNIKFNFDIKMYIRNTNKRKKNIQKYNNFFVQNNINFLQVYYEDLIENKFNIQKEYEFITEFKERYKNVTPTILKQNIYTLEEQLLNYNEVKLALKDDFWFQTTIKEKNI